MSEELFGMVVLNFHGRREWELSIMASELPVKAEFRDDGSGSVGVLWWAILHMGMWMTL